ncbi:unnamed protein product [Caretta caretta]
MTAAARERTTQLAKPKKRDFSAKQDAPPTPPRSITQFTRTAYLARPKTEHPSYLHDKPIRWAVSAGARNAVMSARLSELARPKVRKQIFEGYNPYRISSAALHTEASARLQELTVTKYKVKSGRAVTVVSGGVSVSRSHHPPPGHKWVNAAEEY